MAVLILISMAFFNVVYIYDLVTHHKLLEAGAADGAGPVGNEGDQFAVGQHIVEGIKMNKKTQKLKIKVMSSREEAKIFVNEKEVCTYVTIFCVYIMC